MADYRDAMNVPPRPSDHQEQQRSGSRRRRTGPSQERDRACAVNRQEFGPISAHTRETHIVALSEVPRRDVYTIQHGRLRGLTRKPMAFVAGCYCGWHGPIRGQVRQARQDRADHLAAVEAIDHALQQKEHTP